jgi:hypothetical protein
LVTSAGLVLGGTFAVFTLVGGRGSGGSQIRDVGVGPPGLTGEVHGLLAMIMGSFGHMEAVA